MQTEHAVVYPFHPEPVTRFVMCQLGKGSCSFDNTRPDPSYTYVATRGNDHSLLVLDKQGLCIGHVSIDAVDGGYGTVTEWLAGKLCEKCGGEHEPGIADLNPAYACRPR